MEDNNPRVGEERLGGRGDEYISGREGAAGSRVARTPGTPPGTAPTDSEDTDRRTREIRRDIEQTREDMSETVEAIQDRLRPGTIASNAVDTVRTAASEKVQELADTEPVQYARANPIPTAMVGIGIAGLAWLAFGGREADRYGSTRYRNGGRMGRTGYYGPFDDFGASQTERFGQPRTGGDVAPGMSAGTPSNRSFGDQAFGGRFDRSAERGRAYGSSGRFGIDTGRMTSRVRRTWNQSPLLVGAAAAVVGAIVGMAVPETERENELMGETRDGVIEGVQQTVREKVDQVQQATTDAIDQVQSAIGVKSRDDQRGRS